jgi:hypothetical protein
VPTRKLHSQPETEKWINAAAHMCTYSTYITLWQICADL